MIGKKIYLLQRILQTSTKIIFRFFNSEFNKKDSYVNWDPIDKTVLANEQVIDGKGWKFGQRKKLSQWFLKLRTLLKNYPTILKIKGLA